MSKYKKEPKLSNHCTLTKTNANNRTARQNQELQGNEPTMQFAKIGLAVGRLNRVFRHCYWGSVSNTENTVPPRRRDVAKIILGTPTLHGENTTKCSPRSMGMPTWVVATHLVRERRKWKVGYVKVGANNHGVGTNKWQRERGRVKQSDNS